MQDSPCLSLSGQPGNRRRAQRGAGGKGQRDPEKQPQNNLLFLLKL